MKFLFETETTMKPYNDKKWWIDKNAMPEAYINADSLKEALTKYQKLAEENGITISNSALKTAEPMYVDSNDEPKQVGLVITASTDFYDSYNICGKQYIELWTEILTIVDTEF
jgi:hypothetical protein